MISISGALGPDVVSGTSTDRADDAVFQRDLSSEVELVGHKLVFHGL